MVFSAKWQNHEKDLQLFYYKTSAEVGVKHEIISWNS